MKKRRLILVPLTVVIVLISGWLLINHFQTPAWHAKLDQYLVYLRQTGQSTTRVIATDPAVSPANFTSTMSAETYGDSVIFETSHNLYEEVSTGLQPMPYPPQEVMCVLMDVDGERQVVYVALHSDLYNADWIVHISPEPWGSSMLQSQLVSLGCTLET